MILNYKEANWHVFKQDVEGKLEHIHVPIDRNLNEQEIDDLIENISSAIQQSMSTTIPKIELQSDNSIILPSDTLDLIRQKKRMRRRLNRIRYSANCHQLQT